jgi:hypothetical protein
MEAEFINANLDSKNEILEFENNRLKELYPSEIEQSLARWNSPWREESLDHYLKQGWSFIARDRNSPSPYSDRGLIIGYFLAQPLLFLDGQTQSLWIEHVSASNQATRDSLCEFAYRLSREKHFQKVYFPKQASLLHSETPFKATPWQPEVVQVLTTKVQQ